MISVVLAEDHEVVRSGLRLILEAEDDLEVAGEAGSVEETIRKLKAYRPAILVLDVNMGGESSLDALSEIRQASAGTRIVVLTMQGEPEYARAALQGGASGYLLKDAADSELVEAVRAVGAGQRYVQPSIGALLAAGASEPWPPDGLSDREVEVLRLIALGHTNREIGEELFLSVRTVESHRAHIQRKLGLRTRAELVAYALDRGLMKPPPNGGPAGAHRAH